MAPTACYRLPDESRSPTSPRSTLSSETSPLLSQLSACEPPGDFQPNNRPNGQCVERDIGEERWDQVSWKLELRTIAVWSIPIILSYLLQRSINIMSVLVVGRIGPTELGAVSVASLTTNMIGNTLVQGLANGLDTLAAQAYGSGHYHLVGLHTQRMVYFILPCVTPLIVSWWFADNLLARILPNQQVASLAGLYLKIMILRVPAFVLFECGKRFVQAQRVFYAATYVLLIGAPVNAFIMWLFVWHWGWGFVGGPIAIAISENLMVVLLFLYIWLVKGSECWGGFTRKAFVNWGPMIRLSVPGMIMHVTEFAAEEVLTLAAAQLGTAQLAAQSVVVTIVQVVYIVPLGASIAASIRVANWIGAKAVRQAIVSSRVTALFGLGLAMSQSIILLALLHQLPFFVTRDPEVHAIAVAVLPVVIGMIIFDTLAGFAHGLLRAVGLQAVGGYMNIVAYYMVALPIAFVTTFVCHWGLKGLWAGMGIGLFIVSTFEFWWLYRSSWQDAVDKAERRNESN